LSSVFANPFVPWMASASWASTCSIDNAAMVASPLTVAAAASAGAKLAQNRPQVVAIGSRGDRPPPQRR
jgi:hypothetical protein